ncbi:unnamed protein product [Thelazia callipaeda]|uniref:SET domain-containing protein n=1 Tax=Thelazia callipaeda TaxID=103827 RepID=A0A0N5CZR4_THECL|nr:unnamed protein product [Thelazia callipaeda]
MTYKVDNLWQKLVPPQVVPDLIQLLETGASMKQMELEPVKLFIKTSLDRFNCQQETAKNMSSLLAVVDREYFSQFGINWKVVNNHIFDRVIYQDDMLLNYPPSMESTFKFHCPSAQDQLKVFDRCELIVDANEDKEKLKRRICAEDSLMDIPQDVLELAQSFRVFHKLMVTSREILRKASSNTALYMEQQKVSSLNRGKMFHNCYFRSGQYYRWCSDLTDLLNKERGSIDSGIDKLSTPRRFHELIDEISANSNSVDENADLLSCMLCSDCFLRHCSCDECQTAHVISSDSLIGRVNMDDLMRPFTSHSDRSDDRNLVWEKLGWKLLLSSTEQYSRRSLRFQTARKLFTMPDRLKKKKTVCDEWQTPYAGSHDNDSSSYCFREKEGCNLFSNVKDVNLKITVKQGLLQKLKMKKVSRGDQIKAVYKAFSTSFTKKIECAHSCNVLQSQKPLFKQLSNSYSTDLAKEYNLKRSVFEPFGYTTMKELLKTRKVGCTLLMSQLSQKSKSLSDGIDSVSQELNQERALDMNTSAQEQASSNLNTDKNKNRVRDGIGRCLSKEDKADGLKEMTSVTVIAAFESDISMEGSSNLDSTLQTSELEVELDREIASLLENSDECKETILENAKDCLAKTLYQHHLAAELAKLLSNETLLPKCSKMFSNEKKLFTPEMLSKLTNDLTEPSGPASSHNADPQESDLSGISDQIQELHKEGELKKLLQQALELKRKQNAAASLNKVDDVDDVNLSEQEIRILEEELFAPHSDDDFVDSGEESQEEYIELDASEELHYYHHHHHHHHHHHFCEHRSVKKRGRVRRHGPRICCYCKALGRLTDANIASRAQMRERLLVKLRDRNTQKNCDKDLKKQSEKVIDEQEKSHYTLSDAEIEEILKYINAAKPARDRSTSNGAAKRARNKQRKRKEKKKQRKEVREEEKKIAEVEDLQKQKNQQAKQKEIKEQKQIKAKEGKSKQSRKKGKKHKDVCDWEKKDGSKMLRNQEIGESKKIVLSSSEYLKNTKCNTNCEGSKSEEGDSMSGIKKAASENSEVTKEEKDFAVSPNNVKKPVVLFADSERSNAAVAEQKFGNASTVTTVKPKKSSSVFVPGNEQVPDLMNQEGNFRMEKMERPGARVEWDVRNSSPYVLEKVKHLDIAKQKKESNARIIRNTGRSSTIYVRNAKRKNQPNSSVEQSVEHIDDVSTKEVRMNELVAQDEKQVKGSFVQETDETNMKTEERINPGVKKVELDLSATKPTSSLATSVKELSFIPANEIEETPKSVITTMSTVAPVLNTDIDVNLKSELEAVKQERKNTLTVCESSVTQAGIHGNQGSIVDSHVRSSNQDSSVHAKDMTTQNFKALPKSNSTPRFPRLISRPELTPRMAQFEPVSFVDIPQVWPDGVIAPNLPPRLPAIFAVHPYSKRKSTQFSLSSPAGSRIHHDGFDQCAPSRRQPRIFFTGPFKQRQELSSNPKFCRPRVGTSLLQDPVLRPMRSPAVVDPGVRQIGVNEPILAPSLYAVPPAVSVPCSDMFQKCRPIAPHPVLDSTATDPPVRVLNKLRSHVPDLSALSSRSPTSSFRVPPNNRSIRYPRNRGSLSSGVGTTGARPILGSPLPKKIAAQFPTEFSNTPMSSEITTKPIQKDFCRAPLLSESFSTSNQNDSSWLSRPRNLFGGDINKDSFDTPLSEGTFSTTQIQQHSINSPLPKKIQSNHAKRDFSNVPIPNGPFNTNIQRDISNSPVLKKVFDGPVVQNNFFCSPLSQDSLKTQISGVSYNNSGQYDLFNMPVKDVINAMVPNGSFSSQTHRELLNAPVQQELVDTLNQKNSTTMSVPKVAFSTQLQKPVAHGKELKKLHPSEQQRLPEGASSTQLQKPVAHGKELKKLHPSEQQRSLPKESFDTKEIKIHENCFDVPMHSFYTSLPKDQFTSISKDLSKTSNQTHFANTADNDHLHRNLNSNSNIAIYPAPSIAVHSNFTHQNLSYPQYQFSYYPQYQFSDSAIHTTKATADDLSWNAGNALSTPISEHSLGNVKSEFQDSSQYNNNNFALNSKSNVCNEYSGNILPCEIKTNDAFPGSSDFLTGVCEERNNVGVQSRPSLSFLADYDSETQKLAALARDDSFYCQQPVIIKPGDPRIAKINLDPQETFKPRPEDDLNFLSPVELEMEQLKRILWDDQIAKPRTVLQELSAIQPENEPNAIFHFAPLV